MDGRGEKRTKIRSFNGHILLTEVFDTHHVPVKCGVASATDVVCGAASLVRCNPAPGRPLARAARCRGLTGATYGGGGSRGETVSRNRPDGPKQPGSAPGPRFSSSSSPRL